MGAINGADGGEGTVTVNELGSVLNYSSKKIKINIQDTYNIDKDKLSYTKLNDIQTEDLEIGTISYETLDSNIIQIDSNGTITPKALGLAKVKITDETNEYSTYLIVEVIDGFTKSAIKIGTDFTLALKENGTVWAYGDNGIEVSNKPIQVMANGEELKNIIDIGVGNKISIALNNNGEVFTWGIYKHLDENSNEVQEERKEPVKENLRF